MAWPKATDTMDTHFKVRLSAEDREVVEAAAKKLTIRLSAWPRIAGMEKLAREKKGGR